MYLCILHRKIATNKSYDRKGRNSIREIYTALLLKLIVVPEKETVLLALPENWTDKKIQSII